ncbi:MAG: hypothetical protein ABIK83_07560 [Candidatus Zixiibacteriota bacterium]
MAKKKSKKAAEGEQKPRSSKPPALDAIFESKFYFLYYAVAIGILTLILFHKFVFSNQMLFGSDMLQAGVFFRNFFVEYVKAHGSVPQWNPYIFGGMPYVDAFHGDILYPISFVFKMIFPLFRALGWALVFHVFLAGITMYLCARAFKLGKFAATFAGLFYMFAPYFVSLVAPGHDGKMFVTALFPLTIMFLERGMDKKSYLDFVGLGTVIGLIILTPHPQMAYFSLWAIGSYFVFKLIMRYVKERSIAAGSALTGFFLLAIIIGLALSAIQFYPGYKYVKEYSPRAGEGRGGYEWATSWSMHPEEFVGMFVPLYAGVDGHDGQTYWGRNPFKDNTEYVGFFPILFGALGLIFFRDRRKWYLLGLSLVALVYALGATTPLFYLFYYLVPNVKSMRAPSMIMFLASFSFALLGAMGIQYLVKEFRGDKSVRRKKLLTVLLVVTGVYAAFALFWTVAGETLMGIARYSAMSQNKFAASSANIGTIQGGLWLIALFVAGTFLLIKMFGERKVGIAALALIALFSVAEAWRVDFKFISIEDPTLRFSPHSSVPYLQRNIGNDRLIDMTGRMFGSMDYYAYFNLPQVTGYHGNQIAAYDRLIGGLSFTNLYDRRGAPKLPVLNLLSTKFLVYRAGFQVSDTTLSRVYDTDGVTIYMNRSALPRAFLVHDYRVIADPDSTVAIVGDQRFDPRRFMLLDEEPEFKPKEPLYDKVEDCELIEYEPGYAKIATQVKEDAFICLTDPHYPAWKAFIDGEPTKVYRAYSALMAIGVPKGEHVVEFVYESEIYETSRAVTYGAVIFVALSLVIGFVSSRTRRGEKDG